ncbi:helix-turn-helix transcriptional regulator [Agrococcus jenensis]|uniref:Regulatory LuxR family protein n=1 Tax=Agrococcus jenensis TaxID=46353 RepID=A0A3N2ARK7_9MICO|nr:helix-turn-helix transcriptional regulator [Agrococcus jenensis]ROR65689.1 regulatory LuxR family protein [Agrococcus jenensis]
MDARALAFGGVELCRAVVDGQDALPELLALVAQQVGTDAVTLSSVDLADGSSNVLTHGAAPLDVSEGAAWRRLLGTHPYATHLATANRPRRRLTEVVDVRELRRSEVFQVCLEPRGLTYQAALVVERAGSRMTLLSMWRTDDDFSDDDVDAVGLLATALGASLRARESLRSLEAIAGTGRGPVGLTRRQTQVVELVSAGMTNDQVARRLGLSSRTVRKHLALLFDRTGARSRTELAVLWRDAARVGGVRTFR